MTATIQVVLLLLAVLVVIAVVAQRLKLAPSILLVIAGIMLALVPGLPPIELAPELVLLVLLPPLIYSAGVSMSWREFRFNLRPKVWCSSSPACKHAVSSTRRKPSRSASCWSPPH